MVSDPAGTERRGLFALLRALAVSGVDLAHNTVQMAASEGRIVLERVMLRLGLLIAAMFLAAMGLLLVLAGVAVVLAEQTGMEPWAAFVAVGALTLAAGALLAARALNRLSTPDLAFPATLRELKADIAMFRAVKEDASSPTAGAGTAAAARPAGMRP